MQNKRLIELLLEMGFTMIEAMDLLTILRKT